VPPSHGGSHWFDPSTAHQMHIQGSPAKASKPSNNKASGLFYVHSLPY
jgi:hypothetical protein